MLQDQKFDPNLQLIFNSIQLAIYIIIFALSIIKLVKAMRNSKEFLIKFYVCVICIAAIEIGMQAYYVSVESTNSQPEMYIFVIVNLYAISCESIAIFFLSDYWHETKEIIMKESTEHELKEKRHWVRLLMISLWIIGYTAFVLYAVVDNKIEDDQVFHLILTLGCQGMGVTFMFWAILLQIISGNKLAKALGRYEEWLNHISIKKVQFRCLYWMTSFFNLIRISYLIIMTITIEIDRKRIQWQWFAAYIYTLSNCAVLFVYLLGFSTKTAQDGARNTTLLDNVMRQSRISQSSSRSRHETELSESNSNHSRQ